MQRLLSRWERRFNGGLSHQWERCLGSSCLPCCPSSLTVEPRPPELEWGRGVRSRKWPQSPGQSGPRPRQLAQGTGRGLGMSKALNRDCSRTKQGPGGGCPQATLPGATPTFLPAVSVLLPRRVPGGEQALLRTCVPPAATQDTRGRSSARVPCCSRRSHTVSW